MLLDKPLKYLVKVTIQFYSTLILSFSSLISAISHLSSLIHVIYHPNYGPY